MKQQFNRSEILSIAWQIRRQETSLTWGQCQSAAWKSIRLRSALRSGVVAFKYRKEDGEVRQALGTTNENLFRYENKGVSPVTKVIVIKYYDIEVGDWRSCRADRLLAA